MIQQIFKTTLLLLFYTLSFAFEVQKPKVYENQPISGWYMSEKLDGIRGYWDGETLYTKNGNKIYTPETFTKNFPPFPLDGELYTKRDDFEFIQATVLDTIPSKGWQNITYNIFEVPNAKGDFQTRLQKAQEWFETHPNQNVKIIPQIVCKDENHLQTYLEKIIALKGEGVIVKNPSKAYETGRGDFILKVKKFQDMEGKVIGHNYDKKGQFKSLKLQLENGTIFNLGGGFSDKERLNPPKLDEIITFKYYGFTKNGKPKFASFLRIRKNQN